MTKCTNLTFPLLSLHRSHNQFVEHLVCTEKSKNKTPKIYYNNELEHKSPKSLEFPFNKIRQNQTFAICSAPHRVSPQDECDVELTYSSCYPSAAFLANYIPKPRQIQFPKNKKVKN